VVGRRRGRRPHPRDEAPQVSGGQRRGGWLPAERGRARGDRATPPARVRARGALRGTRDDAGRPLGASVAAARLDAGVRPADAAPDGRAILELPSRRDTRGIAMRARRPAACSDCCPLCDGGPDRVVRHGPARGSRPYHRMPGIATS
jgi:hypothetical protein